MLRDLGACILSCSVRIRQSSLEKVCWWIIRFGCVWLDRVDVIFAIVLGTATDSSEGGETGRRCSVSVDVKNFTALDVLEKSHRRVASVVLDHVHVALTLAHVKSWMLENTSLAVGTFRGVVKEVFANRSQVLAAQSFLLLKLVLSVGKTTTLFFLTVFAFLTVEPEAAKFCLDLLFPAVLHLGVFGKRSEGIINTNRWSLSRELLAGHWRLLKSDIFHVNVFIVRLAVVTTLRRDVGTSCERRGSVNIRLLHLLEWQSRRGWDIFWWKHVFLASKFLRSVADRKWILMCERNSALVCLLRLTVELVLSLAEVHFELRHSRGLLKVGRIRDVLVQGLNLFVANLRMRNVRLFEASLHLGMEMSILYVIRLTPMHRCEHHVSAIVLLKRHKFAVHGAACWVSRSWVRVWVCFLHFWCEVLLHQTTRHEDLTICGKCLKGRHLLDCTICRRSRLNNQLNYFINYNAAEPFYIVLDRQLFLPGSDRHVKSDHDNTTAEILH